MDWSAAMHPPPGGTCVWGLTAAVAAAAVIDRPAAGQFFVADVTEGAGVTSTHEATANFPFGGAMMTAGGAVGDFDRDGLPDLFVISGGVGPDRLFMNQGGGSFLESGAHWGLDTEQMSMGASVADYDGDGWLDLFVTCLGPSTEFAQPGQHRLYRNTGSAFVDMAAAAGVQFSSPDVADGFGSAFGDYDLDGDLDLFVCGWVNDSGGNRLFRNEGDGTFADATVESGVFDTEIRGFSPRFVDMNGDRYPELLIAADFITSRYFVNQGDGTFEDLTAQAGAGLDGNGMGHAVGDFDGDGRLDWYVTSIYTVENQTPFVPGTGNMLYMNVLPDTFVESSIAAGVNDGGWGWGTVAVDFDHDGLLDLVETNGWPLIDEFVGERCKVFRNLGGAVFDEIADECGFAHDLQGRGLLDFDFDLDGDRDFVVFSFDDELRLYRNDLAPGQAWLQVALDTSTRPGLAPDGFGSRVEAVVGGTTMVRSLDGGCNFLSQSELVVHFGLGAATVVDELRVLWNDGSVSVLEDVSVDQRLTIGPPSIGDIDGDGAVDVSDLTALLLEWGPGPSPADLDGDGSVGVLDLVLLLLNWT